MLKKDLEKEYKRLQRENKKLIKKLDKVQESEKEKFLSRYDEYDRPVMEEVYRKNLPRFYKILMEDGELPIRVNRKAIIRRKKQFLKEKGFQHYEIEKRFAGEMGLYGYTFVKYEDVTTENFPKMNEALEEFENQVFVDREKKMAEDKGNREAQANIEKKTRLKKKYGNDWQRHW